MRLSRSMLGLPIALLGPLLVLALGITGGCQPSVRKTAGKRTLDCDTTVKVTPGALHGVDKAAIYVCDDPTYNQVSWVADKGVTFSVQFPSTDCPFNPCPPSITDSTPQTVAPLGQNPPLKVYKYTINVTVGGSTTPYDPHVVTGGGY